MNWDEDIYAVRSAILVLFINKQIQLKSLHFKPGKSSLFLENVTICRLQSNPFLCQSVSLLYMSVTSCTYASISIKISLFLICILHLIAKKQSQFQYIDFTLVLYSVTDYQETTLYSGDSSDHFSVSECYESASGQHVIYLKCDQMHE